MLTTLKQYLQQSGSPAPVASELEHPAAVLIAITNHPTDPKVILTRRADHLSTHSGEVALPGGKWDSGDPSLLFTALRETEEEIGLSPNHVEILGALPLFQTWRGVNVAPFVGLVADDLELKPNLDELDAVFTVPVKFFLSDPRIRTDVFERTMGHTWSPAYVYEGYEIWGFTARLLVSLFNDAFGVNIEQESPAPVKDWGTVNTLV